MGRPASSLPRVTFRLPPELLKQIEDAAAANERSLNAEIVYRLQFTFDDPEGPLTDPEKERLRAVMVETMSRTLLEAPEYALFLQEKAGDIEATRAKALERASGDNTKANQVRRAIIEIADEERGEVD